MPQIHVRYRPADIDPYALSELAMRAVECVARIVAVPPSGVVVDFTAQSPLGVNQRSVVIEITMLPDHAGLRSRKSKELSEAVGTLLVELAARAALPNGAGVLIKLLGGGVYLDAV